MFLKFKYRNEIIAKIDKNAQGSLVTFPQMGSFEIVFMNKVIINTLTFL